MVGGEVPWEKHASGSSFGHTGAGGCVSFGDVQNEVESCAACIACHLCSIAMLCSDPFAPLATVLTPHQLAFAYTPNKMQPGLLGDYRSVELIESAYACLASQRPSPSASSAAAASKL